MDKLRNTNEEPMHILFTRHRKWRFRLNSLHREIGSASNSKTAGEAGYSKMLLGLWPRFSDALSCQSFSRLAHSCTAAPRISRITSFPPQFDFAYRRLCRSQGGPPCAMAPGPHGLRSASWLVPHMEREAFSVSRFPIKFWDWVSLA